MKKILPLLAACMVYMLTATTTNAYAKNTDPTTPTTGKPVKCSETNLIANHSLVTGTVSVYVMDDTIMVKFQADGNYSLNETQLYVGDIKLLPTKTDGSPDLNKFPHSGTHAKGTNIVSYDIDIATIKTEKIAIAAYSKLKGITYQTAWAGNIPVKGTSQAKYYEFDVSSCSM